MKIVFFTGHSFSEPQRVSVHFFARAAAQEGHEVRVFVVGVGPINIIKAPDLWKIPSRRWTEFEQGILEYVPKELNSPVDLRDPRANAMSKWFFQSYGKTVDAEIKKHTDAADAIIVESGIALPYLQYLSRDRKVSRTVYLAADDIATVRAHPIVRESVSILDEVKAIATFGAHLSDARFSNTKKIALEKGIDVQSYNESTTSPYTPGSINGISVGNMLFDDQIPAYAVGVADVDFHFIGRVKSVSAPNLHFPGVLPYKDTVPLVRFADFGMLPYRLAPDMSYLVTSSLKLAQFKLCGLPVVGPAYLPVNQDWYFSYTSGEEAFHQAVEKAIKYGKREFNSDPSVKDFRDNWSQVAAHL